MEPLGDAVIGGAIANFAFAALFAIGAFVKSRLNNSHCNMDCGCLQCDSDLKQLDEKLTRTQTTQRNLLKQILIQMESQQTQNTISRIIFQDSPRKVEKIDINLPPDLKLHPGQMV